MVSEDKVHCVFRTLSGIVFVVSGTGKFLEPLPAMDHLGEMMNGLSATTQHRVVLGISSIELLIGICMIGRLFVRDAIIIARAVAVFFCDYCSL